MLVTAQGKLVIVGVEGSARKYFWRGVELTEVLRCGAVLDEDGGQVRMQVLNTTTFDATYAEMTAAGIHVKKVGG